jgi:hypothetical protein
MNDERIRSHLPARSKSHFGSEVTRQHAPKVTSVPKSLHRPLQKSLRFRSHLPARSKSHFGSEVTSPPAPKSLRFRSHLPARSKSHFGSEVTRQHAQKVTSVPKSLHRLLQKSLRFRSHSPARTKSHFGSEVTFAFGRDASPRRFHPIRAAGAPPSATRKKLRPNEQARFSQEGQKDTQGRKD